MFFAAQRDVRLFIWGIIFSCHANPRSVRMETVATLCRSWVQMVVNGCQKKHE
jgi:hypothetical protein